MSLAAAPRDSYGIRAAGRPRPRAGARPGAPARRAAAARRRGAHHSAGGGTRVAPRTRRAGRARRRAHGPHRGGASPPRRGALRFARPPRQRPHHRDRPRRQRSATRARRSSGCSGMPRRTWSGGASTSCSTVGRRPREASSCSTRPSSAARNPRSLQFTLVHRDGTQHQFEVNCTNLLDDEHVGGIVLNCRDITERKAFEEQLTHQAFHDPVTGLANRALFAERVRHAIARTRREHQSVAVVFLDLDDFKTINDSLGHAAGDEVLVEVAKRLADEHPRDRHGRALRRRRVRAPARGHRRSAGGGRHGGSRARGARPAARRGPQGAVAALQHRHLGRLRGHAGAAPRS